ncbi:glycosyltransferase family 4 protein, partial [Thioclava sp. BHET1]
MPRPIACDLTELFVKASTSDKHYGIARVVHEIGIEMFRADPTTKFVIYSQGHRSFHEVIARFDDSFYGGVAFEMPLLMRQAKFRSTSPESNVKKRLSAPIDSYLLRYKNRKLWEQSGISLPDFSLDGYTLFSAGRPQLLADIYDEIRIKRWDTKTSALVHDLFTFHKLDERYGSKFAANFLYDTKRLLRVADQIVANSEFTRDEYIQFGGGNPLPDPKSLVTVPLVHYSPASAERPQFMLPDEPYFLCVGTNPGRKNAEIVLDALLLLKQQSG